MNKLLLFSSVFMCGVGILCGAGMEEINVHRIDTPPKLDGNLSEPCWLSAKPIMSFHRLGGNLPANIESLAVMLYDDKNLYLGMQMRKLPGEGLSDRGLWHGDNIELFLDPGRTREYYFQVAANHRETFSAAPGGDADWKPEVRTATRALPYGWVLELAIPFASLGVDAPESGVLWGANICRSDSVHGLSTLSILTGEGGFHQPDRFASLRFTSQPFVLDQTEIRQLYIATEELDKTFLQQVTAFREAIKKLPPDSTVRLGLEQELAGIVAPVDALKNDAGDSDDPFENLGRKWLFESLIKELSDKFVWRIKTAALF